MSFEQVGYRVVHILGISGGLAATVKWLHGMWLWFCATEELFIISVSEIIFSAP